jgi:hypothetical protein
MYVYIGNNIGELVCVVHLSPFSRKWLSLVELVPAISPEEMCQYSIRVFRLRLAGMKVHVSRHGKTFSNLIIFQLLLATLY